MYNLSSVIDDLFVTTSNVINDLFVINLFIRLHTLNNRPLIN